MIVNFPRRQTKTEIARGLVDGRYEVHQVEIGQHMFALDLSRQSCGLCGGFFPRIGWAAFFYSEHADPWFVHLGCLKEAENWTDQEPVSA